MTEFGAKLRLGWARALHQRMCHRSSRLARRGCGGRCRPAKSPQGGEFGFDPVRPGRVGRQEHQPHAVTGGPAGDLGGACAGRNCRINPMSDLLDNLSANKTRRSGPGRNAPAWSLLHPMNTSRANPIETPMPGRRSRPAPDERTRAQGAAVMASRCFSGWVSARGDAIAAAP